MAFDFNIQIGARREVGIERERERWREREKERDVCMLTESAGSSGDRKIKDADRKSINK